MDAAQCGVYAPQIIEPSVSDWNFSYDLNVNYKLAPDVLAYATYAKSFKTGRHQPERRAARRRQPPILSRRHGQAGIGQPLRGRPEDAVLGPPGDASTSPPSAPRSRTYQATVNNGQFGRAARLSRQCRQGARRGRRGRFLDPPERAVHRLCQRRLHRRQIREVHRRAVPARAVRRHRGRRHGQTPGAPGVARRAQPGQLRHLRPAAARRVEMGLLLRRARSTCRSRCSARKAQVYVGVDGNYRSNFSSNASPSIYTEVDGYALTNFRVGFRDRRLRRLRLGAQRLRRRTTSSCCGRAGQHRPDRRPAGRSADLGRHDQVLVLIVADRHGAFKRLKRTTTFNHGPERDVASRKLPMSLRFRNERHLAAWIGSPLLPSSRGGAQSGALK